MSTIPSKTHSFDLGDGRQVTLEFGALARQADGAVVVKIGKTVMLATIVSDTKAGEEVDFLPLTIEYKEKFSATGKFPGGFIKRETRPSEYEILICRLVDRALRPLFPSDYHANTVVQITLYSADIDQLPDTYACLAASAAIAISDIPFKAPIAEVRVGRIDGNFILNPSITQMETSDLDIMVAGTMESIVMVEGEMKEISEDEMIDAIRFAHEAIKTQCTAQMELAKMSEKAQTKRVYEHEQHDEELKKGIHNACYQACYDITSKGIADKKLRSESFDKVKEDFIATLPEETAKENAFLINQYFHKTHKEGVRNAMLDKQIRLDGRKMNEIRPIWSAVDYLPAAHGSAIFTRGETQSLTSVTLGSKMDEQMIDGAIIKGKTNFILHYNFPPFSTGEARSPRSTSRREIGHGNLAMRALKNVLPTDVPYTIRVLSDVLESNGSSSMATVCAGSLALMDAGIKTTAQVSGIAMGLITDSDRHVVLSDILGDEDHLGDMDFKVTGTAKGITATQMDIKIDGLSFDLLKQALVQAKEGRMHILNELNKTASKPSEDYKDHAPRIQKLIIPKEFIGAVIGPGGKVIQEIQKETGATIYIEEVDDKGIVEIFTDNKESLLQAEKRIKGLTQVPEKGEVYEAKVKSIMPYGAFVEFLPGKEGLLHISEVSWSRLENMDGVLSEGDNLKVKLLDIDKNGRYKLSRKVLMPKPEANTAE